MCVFPYFPVGVQICRVFWSGQNTLTGKTTKEADSFYVSNPTFCSHIKI